MQSSSELPSTPSTKPRRTLDECKLGELAESIRFNGLMQPITVRPQSEGFEIVAGARRFRAAQFAEPFSLPVRIVELSDAAAMEINFRSVAVQAKVSKAWLYGKQPLRERILQLRHRARKNSGEAARKSAGSSSSANRRSTRPNRPTMRNSARHRLLRSSASSNMPRHRLAQHRCAPAHPCGAVRLP